MADGTVHQAPPLGLKPRWLVEEQRAAEVLAAINRYEQAGLVVPEEWIEEQAFLHGRAVTRQREAALRSPLCVRGRNVVNDAVVGEWVDLPDIRPTTLQGIKDWMAREGGHDQSQLVEHATFDDHIVNYGLRYQFWVPSEKEIFEAGLKAMKARGAVYQSKGKQVQCVDDCGDCGLTNGKVYMVVSMSAGMVRVVDDNGHEKDFFMERFRGTQDEDVMK